jgi:DNA-3-methyladenine glycosylase I
MVSSKDLSRCWGEKDPTMQDYHDNEWGVPLHDDLRLFELIVLEGAQAGLSWSTILKRRENYRKAFDFFDPTIVSTYNEQKTEDLLNDPGIIRNRRKIKSAINNAKKFIIIQDEYGSFDNYIWGFVNKRPIINNFETWEELKPETNLSREISKDLKNRGFSFMGPVIVYAFMQSIGIVNDHLVSCFRWKEINEKYSQR